MARHTRREFIGTSAAGALTLAGLAPAQDAAPAAMAIARWKGELKMDEPTGAMGPKLTRAAIEAIGGMKRFVKKGDVVWIKPNIAWDRAPELASTTNPHLVAELVKMCLESGAQKVKVGDNTCQEARIAYSVSGIGPEVEAAGGEMVVLEKTRFRNVNIGGSVLKEIPCYPEMLEADLLINAAIVKHHFLAGATLAMKNYMGVIENREKLHQDIAGCVADLTAYMKPRLSLLDAIRILASNGPTGGNVKDVKRCNTVAASTDIVALDAFGAELLGHKPEEIPSIAAGARLNLGKIDYRGLPAKEIEVS